MLQFVAALSATQAEYIKLAKAIKEARGLEVRLVNLEFH